MIDGILAAGIVAAALSIPASILVYRGFKHRSRYHEFRDAPIKTPATATAGETAFVTGRTHGTGGTPEQTDDAPNNYVIGPVSRKTGVLTAWEIHSLRRWGLFRIKRTWAPEALALETNGFHIVEDDHQVEIPNWSRRDRLIGKERLAPTGTGVTPLNGIDLNGLWIEVDAYDASHQVQPNDQPSEQLVELERRADVDAFELSGSFLSGILGKIRTPAFTRRYRDVTIEPGQYVTIWGTIHRQNSPGESLQLTEPDEGPALITTNDLETLQRRYRYSYWKWVYGLPLSILFVAILIGSAFLL